MDEITTDLQRIWRPHMDCIINGPYIGSNGRRFIQVYKDGKLLTQQSYVRYIMELHLGRPLRKDEDVHHRDENLLNDAIFNLRVVNSTEHRKSHVFKLVPISFYCPVCNKSFSKDGRKLTDLLKKRKIKPNLSGPYCSRSCSVTAQHRGMTFQSEITEVLYQRTPLEDLDG